MQAVQKDFV